MHIQTILDYTANIAAKIARLRNAAIVANDYYHDNEATIPSRQPFDDAFNNAELLLTEVNAERAVPNGLSFDSVSDALEALVP